ncbi:hypothetical protein SDJN03_27391, partial [Cucurbita argyrosperma subsp. sororia]
MTLQILSQKDEGKMAGEVTFLSEKEWHYLPSYTGKASSSSEGAFGSESKVLKRIGSTGQQASIAISKVSGSEGPLSAEPLGVLAVLGVVFPRSLQVFPVGYADEAGGATDYPDFDSSTDARQERKLLGAEAGVPVSGGKREGTQGLIRSNNEELVQQVRALRKHSAGKVHGNEEG